VSHRRWLAGLVLMALLPLTTPELAGADPTPSPTDQTGSPASPVPSGLPLTVRLGALGPLAPQPGDTLLITGTLHNDSTDPVTNLDLSLRYRTDRVGSRSEFDDYATTADGPVPDRRADDAEVTIGHDSLDPGATVAFRLKVPVDSLHLDRRSWQVYEIGIQVVGVTPTGGTETVGRLRTFLPWAPNDVPGVGLPTQVAWVWPLADRPHRLVGSTWLDDDLAASISPDGRLGRLLAAGVAAEEQRSRPRTQRERQLHIQLKKPPAVSSVPVTWAIDPMLIQDVGAMTGGYRVTTGRATEAGRGKSAAASWLSSLRAAVGRGEVLALPYADPDLVAASRAGLAGEVQVAINKGETSLATALNTSTLNYAWPPDGLVDQRSLESLFTAGIRTVVLDGSALPILGGEPAETPGAHALVGARAGNLDALLVDDGLRAVIAAGMDNHALEPLALQRFLSELLMIQAELPSDQRALVVAPDRRWAPDPVFAERLLADTGKVPWVQPVPLSTVLANPVSTKVTREPLNYPAEERAAELSPSYLAQARKAKGRVDAFAGITTPGDGQARDFDDAVLRTLSSAWRDDRGDAATRMSAVRAAIASTMRRVRIATGAGSFVTLTSNSGTVPVTVSNELDTPVRVVVGIASGLHLKVAGNGRKLEVIPPHRRIPIDIKATAQTSGVFPLKVTLYTPSGQIYQPEVQLFVRSTAYGIVALLITGGATAVLMIAVIVRLIRRGLRARRRTA